MTCSEEKAVSLGSNTHVVQLYHEATLEVKLQVRVSASRTQKPINFNLTVGSREDTFTRLQMWSTQTRSLLKQTIGICGLSPPAKHG